jgi:subtilisin family serine protease
VLTRRTLAAAALATFTVTGVTLSAGPAAADPPGSALESYIVTVTPGSPAASVAARAHGLGGRINHVYTAALDGFAVTLPQGLAERLDRLPGVQSVEVDEPITIDTTQAGATWGLDRIDQRALPLSSTFSYQNTGSGVTAYVIDTGIRFDHSEFGGR